MSNLDSRSATRQLGRLYAEMSRAGSLPAVVQHQLFRWACANDDDNLLVCLVNRDDVDPDVDALLGSVGTARVRAAWLARPCRTAAQLLDAVVEEKRVTVLAVLAARADLPADAFARLAASAGVKVATVVATNLSAPMDARRVAARRAGRGASKLSATSSSLAELVAAVQHMGPVLSDLVAETTSSELLEAAGRQPDAPADVLSCLWDRSLEGRWNLVSEGSWHTGDWQARQDMLLLLRSSEMLVSAALVPQAVLDGVSRAVHARVPDALPVWATAPVAALRVALSASSDDVAFARVSFAASVSDPAELGELFDSALASGDLRTMRVLVANPRLPSGRLVVLADAARDGKPFHQALSRIRGMLVEALKRRADTETTVQAVVAFPELFCEHLLSGLDDPQAALVAMVTGCVDAGRLASTFAMVGTSGASPEVLCRVPLSVLSTSWAFREAAPPLRQMLVDLLVARIGGDGLAEGLFERMYPGFAGSFEELLDTCRTVSGG